MLGIMPTRHRIHRPRIIPRMIFGPYGLFSRMRYIKMVSGPPSRKQIPMNQPTANHVIYELASASIKEAMPMKTIW